jgi:hypothetical protein
MMSRQGFGRLNHQLDNRQKNADLQKTLAAWKPKHMQTRTTILKNQALPTLTKAQAEKP